MILCGSKLNLLFLNWVFEFVILCELHAMLVGTCLMELVEGTQAGPSTMVIKKRKKYCKVAVAGFIGAADALGLEFCDFLFFSLFFACLFWGCGRGMGLHKSRR